MLRWARAGREGLAFGPCLTLYLVVLRAARFGAALVLFSAVQLLFGIIAISVYSAETQRRIA